MIRYYLYAIVFNLGILIFIHELGHFLAARAAGVTVERFSIGFGPSILAVKRGATEYRLSLIPFGGYVKMAGMEPGEDEPSSLRPDGFNAKPIALRAFIVAAGPVSNFIWAVVVAIGVLWASGVPTRGLPVIGAVDPGSPAEAAGILPGDRVVSIEGEPVDDWVDVVTLVATESDGDVRFVVTRSDHDGEMEITVDALPDSATGATLIGIGEKAAPLIGNVLSGGPADRAGLRAGDLILSIDGAAVTDWSELGDIIRAHAGEELQFVWARGAETLSAAVVPEEGEEAVGTTGVRTVGLIGIVRSWEVRRLGLGESVVTGFRVTWLNVRAILDFLWSLVRGRVSAAAVGGPIRIVEIASESARWGAAYFFSFMTYMSVNLFLLNLLPLPILDGGHLLLLALEKIRKRTLTEKQLLIWQQIGVVFFVGLTLFLLVKDVLRVG